MFPGLIFLFQVLFNLANQYSANEMFNEALNTYQVIVKNKMFSNAGKNTVSGHKYFITVRIPIDFSAFFSVQEN